MAAGRPRWPSSRVEPIGSGIRSEPDRSLERPTGHATRSDACPGRRPWSADRLRARGTTRRGLDRYRGDGRAGLSGRTGAGLDPLSAALAAIRREFDGMLNQLDAVQRSLEELAKTATPERQTEIAAQIAAIEALREQAPEGRERREAQARFRLELLPA